MEQYLRLCKDILENGKLRKNRTGIDTLSIFGYQMRFSLSEFFPLLTTKKIHLKSVIYELLWFIKGDTNIKYLVDNGVRIWNEWPYQDYKKSKAYLNETLEEFIEKIKTDDSFSKKYGDLGPLYGSQWRNFNGVDQLRNIINEIKNNPYSRRLVLSSWNPAEINKMALPPCHTLMQFYVDDNKLSLQLYQRSADVFLGVPFNIASYSLLLLMVAQVTNLELGEFIHTIGDAHIYINHLEQVKLQLSRIPRVLPKMILNPKIMNIEEFKIEDFQLSNYHPYKSIKGEVAV